MGNCLPKFKKKNKVSPDPKGWTKKRKERNVSEILSRSSVSVSESNSEEELQMIKELTVSDVCSTSVESLVMKKEESVMEELKPKEPTSPVKKPVFFQVDFVQGMPHRMPSRLAERMEKKVDMKKVEKLALTEEDEDFMDAILEEVETKEKLEILEEQQKAAQDLRDKYLKGIREKARAMRSRPPTRAGGYGAGEYEVENIVEKEEIARYDLKESTDETFNNDAKEAQYSDRTENQVGKGEIAPHEKFLVCQKRFQFTADT